MKISVIIPTFNEEKSIEQCLLQFDPARTCEIIVVDGGSTDNTLNFITGFPEIIYCQTKAKGRAIQMNYGAGQANGDWLLFLHADTLLPAGWEHEIALAASQNYRAGAFRITHHDVNGTSWLTALADFRSYYTRYPYGDQAVFVSREAFETLGGYKLIPLMEDYDFSIRYFKRFGPLYPSKLKVKTSFRRFKKNLVKTALIMFFFPKFFRLGISPELLARFYQVIR